MTKHNLLLSLLLIFISFNTSAKTFNSELGISVDLNNDWLALGKKQASEKNKKASLDALKKINIKDEKAEKIIERIRTANVEFIFDGKKTDADFKNNISIQRGAGSTARTEEQAAAACKTLEPELRKLYKEKVSITQCGMIKIDNYSFMSYEYKDVIPGVRTIQHEFQITPNLTFITIGGSKADAVERIRDTQKKIARAIIKYIKSSPDYFKASEQAGKALQQEDYDTAFKQLQILSKVSDPEGLFNMAVFYEHGKVVKKDVKKAFELYNQAAKMSHRHAVTKLGEYHLKGIATKKSPEMAARMFFQAGLMGDPVAQYSFATMLFNGDGVKKKDPQKALQWFAESAGQGYPPAAQALIKIYEEEIKNKNTKAYHPLALIYLQGAGVKQDTDKALKLLEKAAFDGVEESRKALYEIYSKGMFGVAKNEEKANAWKQ
jgi:TPR repeat protein